MNAIQRAVIVEPGKSPSLAPLLETRPFGLLPLGSQSVLEHLLGVLAGAGVREVNLLLSHLPQQTRSRIGDGSRWGLALRCHQVATPAEIVDSLALLRGQPESRCLTLGMGVRLQASDLLATLADAQEGETQFCDREGRPLPMSLLWGDPNRRRNAILPGARRIECARSLWEANLEALRGHGETLHVERGIGENRYLGTGSRLAPSAELRGPCLIGAGVALGNDTRLGPNVLIGAGCVVDDAAKLSDSLVFSGTYVGPYITLNRKIVDGGTVVDIETLESARIEDPTMIGVCTAQAGEGSFLGMLGALLVALASLAGNAGLLALHGAVAFLGRALRRAGDAALAAGLLIIALPMIAVLAMLRRPRRRRINLWGRDGRRVSYGALRLFPRGNALWMLNYASVLWQVIRGRLSLTGSRVAWAAAPRPTYANTGALPGLLSPSVLQRRANMACENPQVADARLITGASLLAHLALGGRFLLSLAMGSAPRRTPTQVTLVGVGIANITMDQALARIEAMTRAPALQQVAFVNPDCLNISVRDADYRKLLARIPLVLADGIGIRQALKWFQRVGLRENVNGTDLFPRLCGLAAERGLRVYFLGARPGIARAAADSARRLHPALIVAGTRDGYFGAAETDSVIEAVNASGADILLVAMGVPAQELWIDRHRHRLQVKVAIGVGGLFDFYSGRIARAPVWLRELGLEWVFRLLQEPRRMWRRYLIGNPLFLWRAWRAARAETRAEAACPLGDGQEGALK